MKLFAAIALCFALALGSQAQTVTGITVETNGAFCRVEIAGIGVGGTENLRWSTFRNLAGTEGLLFRLDSKGYDSTCGEVRRGRLLAATELVRLPYPNQTNDDIAAISGGVSIRFALNDYVYAGDSNVVATFQESLYSQGGTNSSAGSLTVTNLSTLEYPKFAANWATPDRWMATNSTYNVEVVSVTPYPERFEPLAAVQFIAESGAAILTNTVSSTVISTAGLGDQAAVIVHRGTFATTNWSDGALITNRFRACPWIGDVMDSSTSFGLWSAPTVLPAPFIVLANSGGTYLGSVNRVDPVSGNDTTGTTYQPPFNASLHTNAYLTIAKAASAASASNGVWYTRTNVGASVTYLDAGKHVWTGGTVSAGATPATWYRIESLVGTNAYIENTSGSQDITDMVKLVGVAILNTNTATGFDAISNLWTHNVYFNTPHTEPTGNAGQATFGSTIQRWWVTGSTVKKVKQNFLPFSGTGNMTVALRGNQFMDSITAMPSYLVLGNLSTNAVGTRGPGIVHLRGTSQTMPYPHVSLIAFNKWFGLNTVGVAAVQDSMVWTNNWAFGWAQNIWENCTNGSPVLWLSGDGCVTPMSNAVIALNTVLGQRANLAYQDTGTTTVRKTLFLLDNILDDINVKTDIFGTSSNLVGNWGPYYGVGWSGNWLPETVGVGSAGNFVSIVSGISADAKSEGSTSATNYIGFVRRAAWDGVNRGDGNGDYRVTRAPSGWYPSVYRRMMYRWDIDGRARSISDPPGAYSGQWRRAGIFQ